MTAWDPAKARTNLAKHGVEFRDAQCVFDGPYLVAPDRRADYREDRFVAFGIVDGTCLAVVFASRSGDRRIISARRASSDEVQALLPLLEKVGKKYSHGEGGTHS
jgi:uncharacterized DUF497 family protein